jgi:hypothetical protein
MSRLTWTPSPSFHLAADNRQGFRLSRSGGNFRSVCSVAAMLAVLLVARLPAQRVVGDTYSSGGVEEIVRRSAGLEILSGQLARNYTYQQREVRKHIGPHGEVKLAKSETWDVTNLCEESYSRLIQKDDKPLSAAEDQREEEKINNFLSRCKNESEEKRQHRLADEKKRRDGDWAFLRDVVNAYRFQIVAEEVVDGRPAWVVEAAPRKDFHPTWPHGSILSKLQGRIWIDKTDYHWVKAEAEAIDAISLGLFLARIHKGSRLSFEQVRLNDEAWLMRRVHIEISARVLLFAHPTRELEETFFNYKKFRTDIRILPGVMEVPK